MTLSQLALKHDTDKGPQHHNYTSIYEKYLDPLRNTRQSLLELGVGGYAYPDRGGQSLRMWVDYAKDWTIIATDIYRKDFVVPGAAIVQIAQDNVDELTLLCEVYKPTIIIDDASHINSLTIASFNILFPLLANGGLYIIEDTETSYWGIASDGTNYDGDKNGIVEYMKGLCDIVSKDESNIEYIHFYKGVIIIKKNDFIS